MPCFKPTSNRKKREAASNNQGTYQPIAYRITRITGRQQLILEVVSYFQKQYNTEIFEGLGCRKDDMDFPKGDIKNITDVSTWQECGKQQGIRMDGLICLLFEVSKVL